MKFSSIVLFFTFIFHVQGIPFFLQKMDTKIPFPLYKQGSKSSPQNRGNPSHNSKYPLYMMQLYRTLILGNSTDISNLEQNILQESDTVLSLSAKSYVQVGNHWRVSFDLSSLHQGNELRLAELRIRHPSFDESNNASVEIYHTKKGQEPIFLGSFNTDPINSPGSSWKVFNLTKMLQHFLQQGEAYINGEYIRPNEMPEKQRGINTRSAVMDHASRYSSERVMLVVFAKEKSSDNVPQPPKRNVPKFSNFMAEHGIRVAEVWRHRRKKN